MNVIALKNWIKDNLTEALNPVPAGVDCNGAAGILNKAGWTPADVTILTYVPASELLLNTKAGILIEVMNDTQEQKTGQGAYGTVIEDNVVAISVMWVADFSGDTATGVQPAYTDEGVSGEHFGGLVTALKKAVNRMIYRLKADGTFVSLHWELLDPSSGDKTYIKGEMPRANAFYLPPESAEDSRSVKYKAFIECHFVETFSLS